MQLEDGSSPFYRIVNFREAFVAARRAFRFWAGSKDVLNRMWRGFPTKLNVTDRGNLMQAQFWIFRIRIDDGLSERRRKAPFIQLWKVWWRCWWEKARHASLIEQVGFVIERAF